MQVGRRDPPFIQYELRNSSAFERFNKAKVLMTDTNS